MKIVFYNHTGQVSGAEGMLLTLMTRLNPNDFEKVLVCPKKGPLAEMAAASGIPVQTVAQLNARFTWRPDHLAGYCKSFYQVIANLRRKLIDLSPDLVHANSIRAGLVATAATMGLKVKVVWHLHDLLPRHPLSSAIRMVATLSRRGRMIAVSEAVARNFSGRYRLLRPKVKVILNAIDLKKFSSVGIDREEARARLLLAKDHLAIGIVGQLTPRKGQLELLAAFEKVVRTIPQARLLIIGAALFNRDADYEQHLRDTATRLGIADRVMMLGSRDDVPEIMRSLDLLVVNSRREPFGLIVCEAMACKTPVVATDRDGLPEIIKHRENGWLVPFGDEQALVDAIVYLGETPDVRGELAAAAGADVAQKFALERYMIEIEAFYSGVLNANIAARAEVKASGQAEATSFVSSLSS